MTNREIGTARIFYNEDGSLLKAQFQPVEFEITQLKETKVFDTIDCDKEESKIQKQAEKLFGSWFEQMNKIDLIDLNKQKIVSEIVGECLKYPDGNIARISLKFTIQEVV